jgi:hypothetical protein
VVAPVAQTATVPTPEGGKAQDKCIALVLGSKKLSDKLVGYLAEKGASGLETGANVLGLKTIGYPVGSEARRVIGAARERKFVKEALEPGAGSTLEEISKKGKKKP